MNQFENYLNEFNESISMESFLINIVICAILCSFIAFYYKKYGQSNSNRSKFANIFLTLGLTTFLVITIVKSSIALSLGLVGALSIVRFRAAIKEPEELTFLFLSIGVGLATGANQPILASIAIVFILIILFIKQSISKNKALQRTDSGFILQFESTYSLTELGKTISAYCEKTDLLRVSEFNGKTSYIFKVNISNLEQIEKLKMALKTLDSEIEISLTENNLPSL